MKKKSLSSTLFEELWQVRNPHLKGVDKKKFEKMKAKVVAQAKKDKPTVKPRTPLPSKKAFFELTTARNKQLITTEEQNKLRKTVVGFFGLSVGSHAALTWMMESRAEVVKISDPDTIDPTNLNRLRFGWDSIGKLKTEVVKEQMYAFNPFTKVITTNKTDDQTVIKIINSKPKVNVIIDAIDDMHGKLLLRKLCRKHRIPLISAADVGDNVMIDIERHDLDNKCPFFHNRVPGIENIKFDDLSVMEKKKLVIKLIGFEHNSQRMLESLQAIGGSIPTWPQLGATASIAGGVITTLIKNIILGEKIISGRYFISLDDIFISDFNSDLKTNSRNKIKKMLTDLIFN